MFEAVNSVLSNAPLVKGATEQSSVARNIPVATVPSAPATPDIPFISLYISVDLNFDKAVLQVRDSDTGDVLSQFPSEQTLAARQRTLETQARNQPQDVREAQSASPEVNESRNQVISIQASTPSEPSASTTQAVAALSIASDAASSAPRAQAVSVQA